MQNWYHQDFQCLMVSSYSCFFFHEVAKLMQRFVPYKFESRKKNSIFLMASHYYTLQKAREGHGFQNVCSRKRWVLYKDISKGNKIKVYFD